jgi:hypothetical protein
MRFARCGIGLLAIHLLGCEPPGPEDVQVITRPTDDPVVPDQAQLALCAGLDECSCAQAPGCVPITTDCWCPPVTCGLSRVCSCQGGRFLGCGPAGKSCRPTHCPLLGEPSLPDDRGCLTCAVPTDCATAVALLTATCPSLPADIGALCNQDPSVCATFCLGQIRSCENATCGLCSGCACSNDSFTSCMDECSASMLKQR